MNAEQKLEWLENLLTNVQLLVAISASRKDVLEIIDVGLKIIDEDSVYTEREMEVFTLFCQSIK